MSQFARKLSAYLLGLSLILNGLIGLNVFARSSSKRQHASATPSSLSIPSAASVTEPDEATRERVVEAVNQLPLRFEENSGRADSRVRFISRGQGYQLFLTPTEAVLTLRRGSKKKEQAKAAAHNQQMKPARRERMSVVRMRLVRANEQTQIKGEQALQTPTNYFIGNDKSKWHTAANYERVRYESVYRGIDLVYYGKQRELEYDFEVSPGADPRKITMQFKGVSKLRIDEQGELVLKVRGGGEVRQHKPITYQVIDGERREIESRYVLKGKKRVGFRVGEYDRSEKLVIDPVLSYSTYLGGFGGDGINAIAVDSSGNIYVTGFSYSADFPTLNQYQGESNSPDAFVTKLNPNLSGNASLLYSTYLSGNNFDFGNDIAVDSSGNAYVTGNTDSSDFAILNQYQTDQTDTDAFVTKLDTNQSGNASLLYSTYLGGSSSDQGQGIAVDSSGNVYVTGETASTDLPTLNQFQTNQNNTDAFVTKLNPNASGNASLLYSTYLGGSNVDQGNGIALDSTGNVYVTGTTSSADFPTLNQYQSDQPGQDVFVTKLDINQSGNAALLYSTYLGGSDEDDGREIAVDSSGNAYVTGGTASSDFPTLNQYQSDQTDDDAFVTKLNPNLSGNASLLYSTYLGGDSTDIGSDIAVDSSGNAYVIGNTVSSDFPTLNPYQSDQGSADAFVTKLNTNASGSASLLFSTYLGGSSIDNGNAIAVDSSGNVYVGGQTNSTDFPTVNQYQTDQNGSDAFVTKIRFPSVIADFDGDGKTDPSVWNPNNTNWYFIDSSTNSLRVHLDWGAGFLSDTAVPRDYDGDGETDIAIWRAPEGNWYIVNSSDSSVTVKGWGSGGLGDIPVPADYDGDGKADIAVWRPSEGNWYILNSSDNTVTTKNWGAESLGDVPVVGDYDGDGEADIAVWRGSEGNWYIINSSTNTVTTTGWGASSLNDQPVQADYDGDGKTDIAVWRPDEGNWYIRNSSDNTITLKGWGAGSLGDVPVPGDYDGDGKADIAVWRESEGNWYILQSSNNSMALFGLGTTGDTPAPNTYLP